MKRLKKKAANQTLYHATSIDAFFSILNSGELKPQESQMSDWAKKENIDHYFYGDEEEYNKHMSNYTGFTFFATDEFSAQQYGTRASDKSSFPTMYVIIQAELPEEVLMPDLNDAPNATTWEDSARDAAQVCVLGNVTVDKITGLIFILRDIHEVIETTLENWQIDLKNAMAQSVRRGYLDIDNCYELWDKLGIPHNRE